MTSARMDPSLEWLRDALGILRTAAATLTLPLDLPGRDDAYREAAQLVAHIDGYLMPRLGRTGGPLLAVIGGSTGAGKSTLMNSVVRSPISPAGVLRPTTRAPVIACHPRDATFFGGPGLPAVLRPIRPIVAPALTPGIALLDAPDIDSLVASNRELAMRLFDAADLWIFVTTAARYADAAPWRALSTARDRGAAMVVVLNRVPPPAQADLAAHFAEMLDAHGLDEVPYFVLPETTLDGAGMLPEDMVSSLRDWLAAIARDPEAAATVNRQTLDGALRALDLTARHLAKAARDQADAVHQLDTLVLRAHGLAKQATRQALRDGSLLRGEVLARWRALSETDSQPLTTALEYSLQDVVLAAAEDASEHTTAAWSESAAGRQVVATIDVEPPAGAADLIATWLGVVSNAAERFKAIPRAKAGAALAVRSLGPDDSLEFTGHEYAKALAAMGSAADRCHDELATAIDEVLDEQAEQYRAQLRLLDVDADAADIVRIAAHRVTYAEQVVGS